MKKLIISGILATMIYGCASDRPQYGTQQFNNENYQQNVANAIEFADNFVDFDQKNIPKASLDANDFSTLLSADMAFNQGAYAKAGDYYYALAQKYKDPRIIYKGIICFEHTSSSPAQFAKLNQLIDLLAVTAPDSKISKLFGIRIALDKNDLSAAKSDLKQVMNSQPSKPRAVLLFLSTIVGNDASHTSSATLEEFAKYVESKYDEYPESLLFATIVYSITQNQADLFASLDRISDSYPNWEIPIYWSAGILAKHENIALMNSMLQHEIAWSKQPSSALLNLYVASLISSDQLQLADNFIESALIKSPGNGNLMVNEAIIKYKEGNNQASISSLLAAKKVNVNLDGAVDLALANLYSSQNKHDVSIQYYKNVLAMNPLLAPAANMGIFRSLVNSNQIAAANNFVDGLVSGAKLTPYDAAILKISLFVGMGKYEIAYQTVSKEIKTFSHDKTYVYLYASLSGMTNRTKQAITWYNKYITLNPGDPVGYNDLAFIYADKTNEYLKARDLAVHAYQLSPQDPAIQDTLGWAYYKLGDYSKALPYLLSAYRMTQDRDTAIHLKSVYQALGQKANADKVIVLNHNVEQMQFERTMLNQAMLILMYYQYGLDLSR